MIEAIPTFILVWLIAVTLASALASCIYPLFTGWICKQPPALRAALRLIYACLPLFAALLAAVIVSVPTLAGLFIPTHCHGSSCAAHAPFQQGSPTHLYSFAWFFLAALIVFTSIWCGVLLQNQRRLKIIRAMATTSDHGYLTLQSDHLLACCIGTIKPQIVLSSGLIDLLDDSELKLVVTHERTHLLRRDNLRTLFLCWATWLWFGRQKQQIRNDMRQDAEQAFAVVAAQQAGSTEIAAQVVQKLAGVLAVHSQEKTESSHSIAGPDISLRLAALQNAGATAPASAPTHSLFCLISTMQFCTYVIMLSAVTHPLIEIFAAIPA